MKTAFDIEQLSFGYGGLAVLKGVTFKIPVRNCFIVIGPNGSGKTTLMKIMAGILQSPTGRVRLGDREVRTFRPRELARRVAYLPQSTGADIPFTVYEVVLMGRSPHLGLLGIPGKRDRSKAEEALAFTGVDHLAGRRMDRLSGGERQRVLLARAICQDAAVVLLDEPTSALDLAHQASVMDLMERLRDEKGVTVVMISHDINLAAMYADRILLLDGGGIRGLGPPVEVLTYRNLEAAYGCPVLVDESPLGGFPRITLVPARHLTAR